MKYDCEIVGEQLACTIVPDRDLAAPVFCFSGMAPMEPAQGGTLVRSVGSYTEVQLPDLAAGEAYGLTIRYQAGFKPANRAWMPLGPYLRVAGGIIELPPTPAGRRAPERPLPQDLKGLKIAPQPDHWAPSHRAM